jgi:hypothetical protein
MDNAATEQIKNYEFRIKREAANHKFISITLGGEPVEPPIIFKFSNLQMNN